MKKFVLLGLASAVVFAAAAETGSAEVAEAAPADNKSIVPSKYQGKYKNGGSDALAEFIKTQCTGKDGFEFTAFFELCRKNIGGNLTEEKIAHYEAMVSEKARGGEGRARMTLRNMLASIARKEGKLRKLNDKFEAIEVAKPAASGAAKKAAETAAEGTEAGDTEEAQTE